MNSQQESIIIQVEDGLVVAVRLPDELTSYPVIIADWDTDGVTEAEIENAPGFRDVTDSDYTALVRIYQFDGDDTSLPDVVEAAKEAVE